MTNESRAFFEAVAPPDGERCSALTDRLYADVSPLHELAAAARVRLVHLRLALAKANATEEDVGVYGKFEAFRQAFDAMERELSTLVTAAQLLGDISYQIDGMGIDVPAQLAAAPPVAP
ncbi:MAG: hypothetical protein HYV19_04265 [Gemmatimonadetes bacterium]|nr:hypothetical protein [Gemmatimonadota bacterium]